MEEHYKFARDFYSKEWIKSSLEYDKKQFYHWCLNSIKGKEKILEIGCGGGISTDHILTDNHQVIAIDENPKMIEYAKAYLKSKGHNFNVLERERFIFNNPIYKIDYSKIVANIDGDNFLVEGDFLVDYRLDEWLSIHNDFDAVICWFIGVHGVIAANEGHRNLYDYKEHNPMIYRMNLHKELINRCGKYLKPGGIINIIDRTQYFENEHVKSNSVSDFKRFLEIEKTDFDLLTVFQKEIENPENIDGVPVKATYNTKVVEVEKDTKFALTSFIFAKN